MNIATVLRYEDHKTGNGWDFRYYILHDYYIFAEKYGVGLVALFNTNDIEKICENCDGLIIPGSAMDINPKYYGGEDIPPLVDEYALDAALIKYFHEHKKPILGICGGHQELNVYFGGTIKRIDDREKHVEYHPTDPHHHVSVERGSFLWDVYGEDRVLVNTHHAWELGVVAPNLKVVSRADDGVIEAIESREDMIFATQWHPERSFHLENENQNDLKIIENFFKLCEENK